MPALIIIFALLLPVCLAANNIILDKSTYAIDETIKITLVNVTPNDTLSIISEQDVFKYSGELENELQFYPRELGNYTVRLSNDEIIDEANFNVVEKYVPDASTNRTLYTDKKEYLVNEPVLIHINATEEYDLAVISETEVFKYLGLLNELLPFIPRYAGQYKVELGKDFVTVATTEFEVVEQITSQEETQQEATISEASEPTPESPQITETAGIDETGEEATEEEQLSIILPAKLELKDKAGITRTPAMQVLRAAGDAYDVELFPGKAGISNIKLRNLKIISDKNLVFDEVSLKRDEIKKEFKDKNVIRSFFIDASELNFTNGTITSTAAGRELWKCKEWNSTQSLCLGSWEKIMDLTPGMEYEIMLGPGDPAYAETGLASINTKKPIYHPGENAEIIIVVLDTSGHLVSNAQVSLIITAPDNATAMLTTSQGSITETSRGIYETTYTGTSLEGIYELYVTAQGRNVNSIMQSSFEVREFYEFDILRAAPVTIDPWQGPFESSVRIISYVNASIFDFTEVLPSEFIITDSGGAEQRVTSDKIFLTWTNIINNSIVKYFAQAPLITPNLYELGKSFISYTDSILRVFTESRFWQLAIDPLVGLFFEDFESEWGCRKTTTPAAGDNCSITPWGSFTNCNIPSTARFCTTDDGQEGNHVTYAIQMTYWGTWNETQGLWYWFDPSPYDDINVNGYQASASLDNNNEFCRVWARDSDSWATIYQCVNNVPAGCEAGDTTPEQADYRYFNVNLSSLIGINLSETNLSVHIGAQGSATNDYCFFDRINITGITSPPNITNLTYPGNNTLITVPIFNFNFTVNATKDPKLPNCTLYANFTGSWQANTTIYNVTKNTETNITLSPADGTYIWNVICYTKAGLYDWHDYNYTVTIDARPPVKTIINIDDDTSPPWETTNRNPFINISLNKNGNCRMSLSNESYADMSDDYDCTGDGTTIINCTYTGAEFSIGDATIYIACNDTSGHADSNSTNIGVNIDIVCDSHADCTSDQYCNYQQNCVPDALTGYTCENLAYGGGEDHEVCGDGTNKYCVNDSTYSFTSWYCTADTDDCVYNNQAHSYDLSYRLCNSSGNDYKQCEASNQWGAWIDCAEQYDPYNQTATYHPGEYCAYYATAQSCVNGTTGGCSGAPTNCNSHIYNQTDQVCGSIVADCDLGCGASCDPSNSTAPGIISGTCYYDKSCTNACSWSQSNEEAPEFCINDNDGGACAYNTRTNPTNPETCYWNFVCQDITGASLTQGTANNLRADYCDYCNATSNQSGQYAPAPNASCSSGCADSGTIYYDSGATPGDRSDDCSSGITTIMSDTLATGDVWNGSAAAYCDDTECTNDCGTLVGTCVGGAGGICTCTDNDNPELIIFGPSPGAWDNDGAVSFTYTINDTSSGIQNCSLIINGSINMTNTSIDEGAAEQTFIQSLVNGTYNWSIRCYDNSNSHNMNQSEGIILGVDSVLPSISNPVASGTSFDVNDIICLKATASDTISGINRVYASVSLPGGGTEEVDLSDASTTSCDGANGNGVYSAEYSLIFSGVYTWTTAYATDNANNQNSAAAGLSWNVTAGGNMTAIMRYPTANLTINESEANSYFSQNCTATCLEGNALCREVNLAPQFYDGTSWIDMNATTPLATDVESHYCGNLSPNTSASWWSSSWQYRRKISIVNNNNTYSAAANYSIKITMDTTGPDFLDNGNDLRIIYWNGSSNIEIDRVSATSFDSANTEIWFSLQKNIPATSTDSGYYAYYGNSGAGSPPADYNKAFRYYNTGDNVNNWVRYGTSNSITSSGTYINYTTTANNYNTAGAYYSGLIIDDLEYHAEFYIDSADYVMIYARGTTGNTYYTTFLDINDAVATNNHIRYMNAGAGTNIVENDPITNDIALATWHTYTFRLMGSSLASYVDGVLESSATHSSLTSGRIGLHNQAGTFRIRNLRVRSLMSPEPAASLRDAETYPVNTSCNHTFNISSQPDSGNHTHPIRCKANSSNSATVFSGAFNITINDHPYANISYPHDNSWITGTTNINASLSYDSDGTISNYLFEYDNNTAFSSPTTICNSASSNCTWNTTQQNQCENNTKSCYLRLSVTDNDGLSNNTYILLGFDTQGPTLTLDLPRNSENITISTFTANATASDGESGVSTVFFEYRENSTATWKSACNLTSEPYECSWELTALSDSNTYEFRAYANDGLGNIGNYDNHTNITIDRAAPVINLESPANNNYTISTDIIFYYNVSDETSEVADCSLIINGEINETNSPIQETQSLNFTRTLAEGYYEWSINCTDTHGHENNSETRNITIDLTGPTTTLDRPHNYEGISGMTSYTVNASASDGSIGKISLVTFEYRKGDAGGWTYICSDDRGPTYDCTWDITGFEDGNDYQVRAWANDTLGNNGSYDTHTSITIDNNPPTVTLISPPQPYTDGDGNILFKYSTNDIGTTVASCSLIWEGSINQTETGPIAEEQEYQFELSNLTNGNYTWTVNCTDSFGHIGTGGIRNITINILYVMHVNVTTNHEQYEAGTQEGEDAKITTNITDYLGGPLPSVSATKDIVKVHTLSEQVAPWWNTNWKIRKPIYISSASSEDRTNLTVRMNVMGLGGNITSCVNEIRVAHVIDGETPVIILSGDDSTYCEIAFKGDVSAGASNENNYFVYYNNSAASDPGYSIEPTKYSVHFTGFEADDSSPWDGWSSGGTDCLENPALSAVDDTGTSGGSDSIEVQDNTATSHMAQSFDFSDSCGGDICDSLSISVYLYPSSFDNINEGFDIWCDYGTGTSYELADWKDQGAGCDTIGGVNVCEAAWTQVTFDLSPCTIDRSTEIRFTSQDSTSGGDNDQVYIDGINITGLRLEAPNISSTSTGSPQEWVARATSTTDAEGIWAYLYETINHTVGNYSAVSLGQKTNYIDTYNYTFFEITQDKTPPNVTLNTPPNQSEANSSVTFTYYVNDTLSTVTNCSLIIDGVIDDTEEAIREGPIQYFYPRIPLGGWHNWSVNCTDYFGNIGASEKWEIFIKPPDLVITGTDIIFSNSTPNEGDNITINATVFNLGGSDAQNVIMQIFLGDPDAGGTQINGNFSANITEITGGAPNATFNVSWIVTGPGPFNFYAVVDPPIATNGTITELNESNNKAYNTINVPAYNYFYGSVENNIVISNALNQSLYYYANVINVTGNIFVTDEESTIGFSALQAIGRDVSNNSASNDFNDTDAAMNMSAYNDSIRVTFTGDTDTPLATRNIIVFEKQISDVPIINSTNTSSFVTGILWDTSDGGTQYNGTQDILFITQINASQTGAYGQYDYEIRVPVDLKNYHGAGTNVAFYWEITGTTG